MIDFLWETLLLLPFLLATYLVLEAVEAHAGGALERFLGRTPFWGPLAGALAGAVPQCGVSAAAASCYAGGVVALGTFVAVLLSTSDELLPILISERAPLGLLLKIIALKVAGAAAVGFLVSAFARVFHAPRRAVNVGELCAHSHCACREHKGILVPALIHTAEIFVFVLVISGAIELAFHFWGDEALSALRLKTPVLGECVAALLGLIPNCAVSVAGAKLYLSGAMSAGALMASSFSGSGLGLLVLFRVNRPLKENLLILALVYALGVLLGLLTGVLL